MNCKVEGMMGDFCRQERQKNSAYCQARVQADSDLAPSPNDPILIDQAEYLEADVARTYAGCPHLNDIITGIRHELTRRQTEQNQHPSPPGE